MSLHLEPLQTSTREQAGQFGLAWAAWPSDMLTPVGVLAHLRSAGLEPCLLESVDGPASLTAWSLIGVAPDASLEVDADGGVLERNTSAPLALDGPAHIALRLAQELVGRREHPAPENMPPLLGGWIGCFTYEWATSLEPSLAPFQAQTGPFAGMPQGIFRHYRDIVAFDHRGQRLLIITGCRAGKADFEEAQERRGEILAALSQAQEAVAETVKPAAPSVLQSGTDRERYTSQIKSLQTQIGEGEFFQAVLSRRFEAPLETDALVLYRSLRIANPAPHMFFFETPQVTLVGSSPERLVSLDNRRCQAVPIAGTRPRGATTVEDERLGFELKSDTKERAEHDMLVDLARNDLGRVARTGTVEVVQYAHLSRFPSVQHLVSRVESELRGGLDAMDLLAACFPAGTVSGAPKIRAMQSIAALEGEARGPYGGAFGYLSDDGDMDMAIVIRSFVIRHGKVHLQAGAGIVWDSDPDAEFDETGHKSNALAQALELSHAPAMATTFRTTPAPLSR